MVVRGKCRVEFVRVANDFVVLLDPSLVDSAENPAEVRSVDQPDGNRLAVGQLEVARDLECVGEGVAVVEQNSPIPLTLVGSDDGGLDLDAAGDTIGEFHRKQVIAGEKVVLGHLAHPAPDLAWCQGGQRIEVAQHS